MADPRHQARLDRTRRSPGRRIVRAGIVLVVVGLVATATAALAGGLDAPGTSASGLLTGPVGPTPTTAPGSSVGDAPSILPAPDLSAVAGGPFALPAPLGSGTGSGGGAATSPGGTDAGPGAPTSPSATPASPAAPVIISPTLGIFRFGTQVGLPLVCNVVVSALASGVPDPSVAQVAGEVSFACGQISTQGINGIDALNSALASLAAFNPALDPTIEAFAKVLDVPPTSSPFASLVIQIAALVRFFE